MTKTVSHDSMKKLPLYQVDAFAEYPFSGNPAAVVILDKWLTDDLMQKIATENNLSETAFVLKRMDHFEIRWFTPTVEVDLCGHATLASAFVIFNLINWKGEKIIFRTNSKGDLSVERNNDIIVLDFPADVYTQTELPEQILKGIGRKSEECYKGQSDYLLIYGSREEIEQISPDFNLLAKAGDRGVIVSAPGKEEDFVSRFFAPQCGINEDPVTGSAHTTLIPYWSKRLNRSQLTAKQLSKRGGTIYCENFGSRVKIGGKAILFLKGEILIKT